LTNKLDKDKQIEILKYEIDQRNEIIKDLDKDMLQFEGFKKGIIWKMLGVYRFFRKSVKLTLKSLFRDGPFATIRKIYKRITNPIRGFYPDADKYNEEYQIWLLNNYNENILNKYREKVKKFTYKPLISIIMPVYNVEEKWLKEAIESVQNQIYNNWELCIADDASTKPYIKDVLLEYKNKDKRVKIVFRKKNGHISRSSNSALKLARGEFIALLDNDDIIYPQTLFKTVELLNEEKDIDFTYSDEDRIKLTGERVYPFFKPDWCPDLLMSTNYITHFAVIRKSLVDRVGGFRAGFEGSQDHDLFLRILENCKKIKHIPDTLYSWRMIPGSTAVSYDMKSYANTASLIALTDTLERQKIKGIVGNGILPGLFRVEYKIKNNPLISIIIPTKDKMNFLQRCINSITNKTAYKNYEIIIVDNESVEEETISYFKQIANSKKIRIIKWNNKFNYSSINNFGVKNAKGEYILLLNNDTEVINKEWLSAMLEHAQRKEAGAVGAKLLYPDKTIQHAGIVLGIGGIGEHVYKGYDDRPTGIPIYKDITRNYCAVTGACLMVNKSKYNQMNGLDPKFRIAFNDIDFCLKLIKKGYFNIYTPYARLYHHESTTAGKLGEGIRDMEEFRKENEMMMGKWGSLIKNDPYFNLNLDLDISGYKINT
jgi:glycosyltransferase involved in cell wall biosynthesis